MLFKIDENLHCDAADLLNQHGHDAITVFDQGLRGHFDTESPTGNLWIVDEHQVRIRGGNPPTAP